MKGLDWSLQIMQLWTLPCKFFHRPCFHFLQVYSKEWNCWVIYSYSSYVLNILPKLPNCFPEYLYHILIPLVIYGVPFSLHLCQHLLLTKLEVWSSTSYFFFEFFCWLIIWTSYHMLIGPSCIIFGELSRCFAYFIFLFSAWLSHNWQPL